MSLSPPKIDRPAPPPRLVEDEPVEMKSPDGGDDKRRRAAKGRSALRIDLVNQNTAAATGGAGPNLPRI